MSVPAPGDERWHYTDGSHRGPALPQTETSPPGHSRYAGTSPNTPRDTDRHLPFSELSRLGPARGVTWPVARLRWTNFVGESQIHKVP
jgi:hypothetical protein